MAGGTNWSPQRRPTRSPRERNFRTSPAASRTASSKAASQPAPALGGAGRLELDDDLAPELGGALLDDRPPLPRGLRPVDVARVVSRHRLAQLQDLRAASLPAGVDPVVHRLPRLRGREGRDLRPREDDPFLVDRVEAPLAEEADRVAAEEEDRLHLLSPAAREEEVDAPLRLARGNETREEERRRLPRDLHQESGLLPKRPVREPEAEPDRLSREDLGGTVQDDVDPVDVPPRDDARHEEDAEEERQEDVEAVVPRVRRADGDDERRQDEAQAEVRDPDEDRLVPRDLQPQPEHRQLHVASTSTAPLPDTRHAPRQSGTATSSRIFCSASRSRRPAPVPS